MSSPKPTINKRDFKKGIDLDDSRRRREAQALKIRKEKKEEGLAKRRNMNSLREASEAADASTMGPNGEVKAAATVEDIPKLLLDLKSPQDIAIQVNALRNFRRLLSVEKNPPVQQCIDCGAIPLFVEALKRHDSCELQFEAAWALTNIASTDRTRLVVECGAVPLLAALLTSPNADIREQCAWCLGNVAGDGAELREQVLQSGALTPLLQNIMQPASITLLRNCVWSLSNFCRGKPQPQLEVIAPALPVIASLLQNTTDEETLVDAVWALSYLSDGSNARIQAIVDLNIMSYITRMLQSGKVAMIVPALRTMGNIVSGNDTQTQSVLDTGVLPIIVHLLAHAKKNIRKESCWMLSNIAAGTPLQLDALMHTPSLVSRFLAQLGSGVEWDVRKEAVWVMSNIITTYNSKHILCLVEHGVIAPLCDLLEVNEAKILLIAMESLDTVMKVGAAIKSTDFAQLVDEVGGLDKLEYLQEHENKDIYEKAVYLIEKHFGVEEEEGPSENVAPVVAEGGNVFQFGVAPSVDGKPFSFDAAAHAVASFQQPQQQLATPFYTF